MCSIVSDYIVDKFLLLSFVTTNTLYGQQSSMNLCINELSGNCQK